MFGSPKGDYPKYALFVLIAFGVCLVIDVLLCPQGLPKPGWNDVSRGDIWGLHLRVVGGCQRLHCAGERQTDANNSLDSSRRDLFSLIVIPCRREQLEFGYSTTFSSFARFLAEPLLVSRTTINGCKTLRGENASCPCTIVFNTSSLSLDGAVSAVGELARTAAGTEVAVWSFDQASENTHNHFRFFW